MSTLDQVKRFVSTPRLCEKPKTAYGLSRPYEDCVFTQPANTLGVIPAKSSGAKSLPRVTALAIFECQVAAKGASSIVACEAIPASANKVFGGCGETHLARLRRSRCQRMAIGAGEALTWPMFGMTEGEAKCARICTRAGIRFPLMANAA